MYRDLKIHLEMKHLGIRYPCSQCNYIGSYKRSVKVHFEKMHKIGINYCCSECTYEAIEYRNLDKHIKMIHQQNLTKY